MLTRGPRASNFIPDYKRIERSLRDRIASGIWQAGVVLPSRRDLAAEYSVDVNTLQRAIAPLLADGTLCTNGNRGTFVAGSTPAFSGRANTRTVVEQARAQLNRSGVAIRTATIGIIAAVEPQHFWTQAVLHGIESTLSSHGSITRFFDIRRTDSDDEMARIPIREAAGSLVSDGVDGIIVVGVYDRPGMTDEVIGLLSSIQVPLVYLSWHDTHRPMHHVFYDSQHAGYQAAQHLVQSGYASFAFIAPFAANWVDERIKSARMALEDAGLPASALSVYPATRGEFQYGNHVDDGYKALLKALAEGLDLKGRGVIASNDKTAHGIIRAASELGLAAGGDFGLIGFDDDSESRSIGLTTVRPPLESLSSEGARLILRSIEGERAASQIRLHSRLIARSTTCSQMK